MAFYKIKSGRVNGVRDAVQYIAPYGQIFYDDEDNMLRIGDGVTAGGTPAFIPFATSSTVGGIKLGTGFTVNSTGTLSLNAGPMFELDDNDVFQLLPGTADRIGGIRPGPGVVIDSEGILYIDPEGLEFTFGHLTSAVGEYTDTSEYALLSSLNANEDVVVASNGTGSVCIVGELHVHATNGTVTGSLETEPFFQIKSDGQVRILVPLADPAEGGLEIIGNTSGVGHPPNQSGVILHVTGNSPVDSVGQPCRNYFDSRDSYVVLTGRRFNGPADSVTKVLNGETLMRIVGQASTDTGFQTFGPARVDFVATQDQAVGAQGGEIQIYATANNTSATSAVKVASFNGTTGVTATKFVGPLEGNVTGTATTATYAQSFNTGTLVANAVAAVSATTAGTVTTPAQPAITSVGTLTSLTVTNLVTAKNYSGQVRNLGTITAGAGTEITIDFATDHMVRFNYSTEPIQVGFTNYSAGKTVTLIAINTNGANRQLEIGIAAANTQGVTTLDVDANETAIVTYYCTGSTVDDVFASTVYTT
jgi:hypothetical protein